MVKASVVDLRYRMKEILKAIDRNEEVTVLYHGKVKGVIKPNISGGHKRKSDHPFFNLIWIQRGSHRAAGLVEKEEERFISNHKSFSTTCSFILVRVSKKSPATFRWMGFFYPVTSNKS